MPTAAARTGDPAAKRRSQAARLDPRPPPASFAAGDFTGREAELAELLAAVGKQGKNLVLVRGTGGVGKTALALKLAQELSPAYPDAQLYLDLKGPTKQPLSAAQAMSHVIRAYQPAAQLPEGEAELAGLYRSSSSTGNARSY